MITNVQVEKLATDYALMVVFSNVDDEEWPADPMNFMRTCDEDDKPKYSGEMIPWEKFEDCNVDQLYDLVLDFKDTFKYAINAALRIERTGK